MRQCCAPECKNQGKHIFPKDPTRRKAWEKALRIKNFKATKHSALCSAHFAADDYFGQSKYTAYEPKAKFLKKTAVPSIFSFTKTKLESTSAEQRVERLEKWSRRKLMLDVPASLTTNSQYSNETCLSSLSMEIESCNEVEKSACERQESEDISLSSAECVFVSKGTQVDIEHMFGTIRRYKNDNKGIPKKLIMDPLNTVDIKECFIPTCTNSTISSPHEFLNESIKKRRYVEMNVRDRNSDYFAQCKMFCCEDHLNSEIDAVGRDCGLIKDEMDVAPTSTLFCICCLEKGTLYINLLNCSHTEFLNNLNMPEVKLAEQVICYQCHYMLKKIKLFKLQVEESFKLLSDKVANISQSSIKRRNFEACLLHNIDYPSTTSETNPQKTKNEISQTKENETPLTREMEIPQTKENEISRTRKNEIPQKRDNEMPQIRENEISQAKRRKTMTGIDGLKTEDNPETNNTENPQTTPEQAKIKTEISFLPSRSQNISKNIEDALKIINTNQNSGCIDLLAKSLQTISYSFLENILCNSNLPTVSQITSNTNPASMLFGINTPTTSATTSSYNIKEKNSTNLEIGRQSVNPTDNLFNNNTPTTNNTTDNNNTNLDIGRQSVNPTDKLTNNSTITTSATTSSSENISINNTTRDNNTNFETGRQSVNPTDNLSNKSTPTTNNATVISSENVTINNTTENNNTNVAIGRQISTNPTDNLININTPTTSTTSISSENITINNTTRNNNTKLGKRRQRRKNRTDKLFNISIRTPSIINATVSEHLDKKKDESMDGGQPMLNKPGSNIKQVTITRDELMEERSKLASSKTYRRYQLRCDPCLMGFEFKENLDDHVRRKHSSERLKDPVQCDVCSQFMDASYYKNHSIWHFTRYECPVCSQKFASFDDAAQHYRKHPRGDKRKAPIYKCLMCPYKTAKLGWLEGHVRRVTKCKSCDTDITHGCGTGVNFYRHEATCKGRNP